MIQMVQFDNSVLSTINRQLQDWDFVESDVAVKLLPLGSWKRMQLPVQMQVIKEIYTTHVRIQMGNSYSPMYFNKFFFPVCKEDTLCDANDGLQYNYVICCYQFEVCEGPRFTLVKNKRLQTHFLNHMLLFITIQYFNLFRQHTF